MTITPCELLDISIAQLRTLAAFIGEQLGRSDGGDRARSAKLELRACNEVLVSLGVLIPKLQKARNLISGGEELQPRVRV